MTDTHEHLFTRRSHMGDAFEKCIYCGVTRDIPDPHADGDLDLTLARAFSLLDELYTPAGILRFWSSRNKMLGGRRPCDLTREGDVAALSQLGDYLDAMADGAFL